MTTTVTRPTYLSAALADLEAAKRELGKIERENAPTDQKYSAFLEQYDNAKETLGADSPDARRAKAGLTGLKPQWDAGQRRLKVQQLRVAEAERKVASERQAIHDKETEIAGWEKKVAIQAEALEKTQGEAVRQAGVLEGMQRQLVDLRRDLAALIGETTDGGAP